MDEPKTKEGNDSLKEFTSPGSDEAIEKGCTCPVLDNAHGEGAYIDPEGDPVFWFDGSCPIHGSSEHINPETILRENK